MSSLRCWACGKCIRRLCATRIWRLQSIAAHPFAFGGCSVCSYCCCAANGHAVIVTHGWCSSWLRLVLACVPLVQYDRGGESLVWPRSVHFVFGRVSRGIFSVWLALFILCLEEYCSNCPCWSKQRSFMVIALLTDWYHVVVVRSAPAPASAWSRCCTNASTCTRHRCNANRHDELHMGRGWHYYNDAHVAGRLVGSNSILIWLRLRLTHTSTLGWVIRWRDSIWFCLVLMVWLDGGCLFAAVCKYPARRCDDAERVASPNGMWYQQFF